MSQLATTSARVSAYFETNIERIQDACKEVDINAQVMDMLQVVAKSANLQKCTPASIVGAVITASRLGISLDPNMKHAYLIPYAKECKLEVSYIGLIDIVSHTSGVRIESGEVRSNDVFILKRGDNKTFEHEPVPFVNRGEVIGYYARALFPDGSWDIETMDMDEIAKCKKCSKGGTVWATWGSEMARKSVIRRLVKKIPKNREASAISSYDERSSIGEDVSDLADVEGVEPPVDITATEVLDELTK